jgi:hypothetical protein
MAPPALAPLLALIPAHGHVMDGAKSRDWPMHRRRIVLLRAELRLGLCRWLGLRVAGKRGVAVTPMADSRTVARGRRRTSGSAHA